MWILDGAGFATWTEAAHRANRFKALSVLTMHADGPRALLPPTAAGAEKALAACPDPAWLIDPAKGRVLAANPAGAARLGLHPDAASGTLDAAMPGLTRLRAMVRESIGSGKREPLIFWTAYGAESLVCDVAAMPDADDASAVVLVSIASGVARRAISYSAGEMPVATLPPPVAAAPEDAATMSKIAAAIRNGFSGARGDAGIYPDEDASDAAPSQNKVLVSKLAHELRTPLSAIAAAAEIMKDERFGTIANERYRSYTSDIHDNARHALALINRLLGGVVDEDDAPRLEVSELDLNALAESSVSAVQPLADAAGLKLVHEFHRQLPRIRADATTVKQILFNLLSNAIKFTPRGGDVRVVTGLGYDRSVFVAVQDTGVGMRTEAITAALKGDVPASPQRNETGGHGIGLPLARTLAQSNGARVEIDSAIGEGTAVALIFPRDRIVTGAAVSN
jgi:two-component system, cell cycle sensor histidine kinase PleC